MCMYVLVCIYIYIYIYTRCVSAQRLKHHNLPTMDGSGLHTACSIQHGRAPAGRVGCCRGSAPGSGTRRASPPSMSRSIPTTECRARPAVVYVGGNGRRGEIKTSVVRQHGQMRPFLNRRAPSAADCRACACSRKRV